jgi:hypothetical protein
MRVASSALGDSCLMDDMNLRFISFRQLVMLAPSSEDECTHLSECLD